MCDSILTQDFIDQTLAVARQNLETDGGISTVVFLRFEDKIVHVVGLTLPETAEARQLAIRCLRLQFPKQRQLQEAVLVMDSWYVAGSDDPDGIQMPPSQHPRGQQAILVAGRNAENSRTSLVMQSYQNDKTGCLVWRKPFIAHYNQPTDGKNRVEGLIDELFISQGVH